ncbi:Fc.00g010460.m01.CDS01 [Cosmosporella sp. VM-42]
MPETQSTRASPRASTPAKAVRKCKACQSCREKKIKCNGQQPNCAQCQQQGSTCKYGQDRRQTSRVTKGSIDTVYNKIASLESMLKRSLESTQTVLPPLSPQPSVPSPPVEASFASPTNSLNNNAFFSDSIYIGDAPSHTFDTGRPFHDTDNVGDSYTEGLPAPSTVREEGQSGANTNLGGSAAYSAAAPDFNNRNSGSEGPWNARDSPNSTASTDRRRVASTQDINNNGRMVSGIHIRVSNSVHGLTSTFHPQPSTPQTSWSGSPAQPPSEGKESQAQKDHQHDDEEVRNRLFMYAASERQREYAYRAEQKYDLDGIDCETALHLLDLHWNHQHNAYLFSYKPAILHSLATGGPHSNKLLLNALYYSSSLNSDRSSLREPGPDGKSMSDKFLFRFQELLLPELQTSRISSAVAFLQMGSSLFANGNQTAGWLYTGIGYRMIIDLGLHLDPGKIQSPGSDNRIIDDPEYFVEVELQRRVFWGAYVNDKFQSLFFGRPPALPLTGAEPPPIFSDTYEELELWSPYVDPQNPSSLQLRFSPKPGYVVSTFKWLLRLAEISSDITEYLYMPAICKMKRPSVLQRFSRIKDDLHRWNQELPAYLRFEPEKDTAPPAHQFNIQ